MPPSPSSDSSSSSFSTSSRTLDSEYHRPRERNMFRNLELARYILSCARGSDEVRSRVMAEVKSGFMAFLCNSVIAHSAKYIY